jgi:hypothetical protein
MSDNTSTSLDAILLDQYTERVVQDLTYKGHPLLGMLPKTEKSGGRKVILPVQYAHGQGRSGTFADAQGNANPEKFEAFELTWKKDYGVATIEGIAVAQATGDTKSFLDSLTAVIDGAFAGVSSSIGISLFRNGTGYRGQISATSNVATDTITLAHLSQVSNFEVGMSVEASSALGSGSRNSGAAEVIEAVDRSQGTLTATSAAWSTVISAVAASDYLYAEGDFSDGTSASGILLSGLSAWIPSSAPSATAFYGVDRSVDTRLSGVRYDGSSQLIEEALIDGLSQGAVEGAEADVAFVHHVKMRELIKAQTTKSNFPRTI